MINICRKHRVREYSETIIHYIDGNGNYMYIDHRNNAGSCVHWGPKARSEGSPWWNTCWQFKDNDYNGKRSVLEFPVVPYVLSGFHCERH